MPSSIRLITWNCRSGSVSSRLSDLAPYAPDIVFLQECAPVKAIPIGGQVLMRRVNDRKGIALISLSPDYICREVSTAATRESPSIFARVSGSTPTGPRPKFSILGLWAHGPNYVADVRRMLDLHDKHLRKGPVVVMGDLNSGSKLGGGQVATANYLRLMSAMADLGLVSAYHAFHRIDHGRETHATYFHRAKLNDPWHIDFCFVPSSWTRHISDVKIAGAEEMAMSDHRPVLVELAAMEF